MQTAQEFFQGPQPNFELDETVHLGGRAKYADGYVGKLKALDLENDEAVILAHINGQPHIISGHASNLSKLH